MNIKGKFENLKLRDKILLYLIVVMVAILISILNERNENLLSLSTMQMATPEKLENEVITYKKVEKTDLQLIQYLNANATLHKITIEDMSILQDSIRLKIVGDFKKLIAFLFLVEGHFKIQSFEIFYSDKMVLSLSIGKKYLDNVTGKINLSQQISNPFLIKNELTKSLIRVDAIINNEVLIEGKWYKKDQNIYNYKLVDIFPHYIILLDMKTDKKFMKDIYYEELK